MPLVSRDDSGIDVLEIEPEFFWLETGNPRTPMRIDSGMLARLASLSQHKLVHGVSSPVGGTLSPEPDRMQLMRQVVRTLDAQWASEHLSFNAVPAPQGHLDAGFLLPPLQTLEGAMQAAGNLRAMADALQAPVAFENNVSYLRPLPGELKDGDFLCEVARRSDCGILLDLHNLWINEKNGRQPVREVLASLPLERVWEVHLAGGVEHRGFWLDAHSGLVADEVMALAAEVIPALPNLRALIFEMLPEYLPQVGLDGVRHQIDRLHTLWSLRMPSRGGAAQADPERLLEWKTTATEACILPAVWEQALCAAVSGQASQGVPLPALARDPGVALLRELASNARAGQIASVARLTTRLLLAYGGESGFQALFCSYIARCPPRQFASSEALGFLEHAIRESPGVPHLQDVAQFERAVIESTLRQQTCTITFHVDPLPLLGALSQGHAPPLAPHALFRVKLDVGRVTSIEPYAIQANAAPT